MPGSVLQRPGPSRTIDRDDSFVFRISCDLKFLAGDAKSQVAQGPGKFFRHWLSGISASPKDLFLHLGDTWRFEKVPNENLIRGFARVKGREHALQMLKASGQEHKGQVWFLDPTSWGALTDSPPRLLWCDKEARENLLAFANRIFRDAGQFGVARGRVQLALRVKADDSRLKPVVSTWHASTVPAASLLSPMLSKLPARTAAPMSPMICRTPLMLSQTFGNKFGNGTLNVKSCCACVATP